jgi:hypothetical protein
MRITMHWLRWPFSWQQEEAKPASRTQHIMLNAAGNSGSAFHGVTCSARIGYFWSE